VNEARHELQEHPALAVERHLVLNYPSALYFFVHPDNEALARAIESGLELAIADGSLRRMFLDEYADDIAAADLPHRRVLRLRNADLPEQTPLDRAELWFDPVRGE
jgi:membrane-bound lytic murein transglycosylase MltF